MKHSGNSKPGSNNLRYGRSPAIPDKNNGSGNATKIRLQKIVEAIVRWTIVAVISILIIGGLTTRSQSQGTADQLADELAALEVERDKLKTELLQFSDDEWREKFWKWRTMSRSPGEYYIDFVDSSEH